MGLSESEYAEICRLMGRQPTLTELGMFAVMWSEHCGYKYSKPVLARFKRYRESLEGAGFENAGEVDLGGGWRIAMKVESHNHPSAVEPYQGAATGVGGIIRDIFTMGARPIAALDSLRFGPIIEGDAPRDTVLRNRYLFEHVVAGIGGYGNCVGVPTVAGEVAFHPRYSGNPIVNAMCVGITNRTDPVTSAAAGPGNPVVYMGSATGLDGIHGATFASESLGEDSEAKRPNVQIGDPFEEKLLIEATLEALDTGAIVAIQDMGAAGLTCSTVEMSSKGGVGMDIDLDLVPTRSEGMSAYELMLSESQERMLAVVQRGREQEVIAICRKWGVRAVVIGEVVEGETVTVRQHGRIEAQVQAKHLTDHCPTYTNDAVEPAYYAEALAFDVASAPSCDPHVALPRLLACPDLASKAWVYRQYDHQVQTQTALTPGKGDAAVLLPRGPEVGIALKIDGNGRWVYADPYVGGLLAVCEAARNVACVGAKPTAITDGLNFGNPQLPHVYWQFTQAVSGIADAAEALGTPVISGNVSFYNESELGEILPTPLIGMLGVLPNRKRHVGMAGVAGAAVGLLWSPRQTFRQGGLGASSYLAHVHGIEAGVPERPDLEHEAALHRLLVELVRTGAILCAHDVSESGLAVAASEMAIAGGVGVDLFLKGNPFDGLDRFDSRLFGEFSGWVLVGVEASWRQQAEDTAANYGVALEWIGEFCDPGGNVRLSCGAEGSWHWALGDLADAYSDGIARHMRH